MAIPSAVKIVLVAVAAGGLGLLAGQLSGNGGWLLRTEVGQRVLQEQMARQAPPPPAGLAVAKRGEPMPALSLPVLQPGPGPAQVGEQAGRGRPPAGPGPAASAAPPSAADAAPAPGAALGAPIALPQAYAGRPVLINVWASWCPPCIKEMPELDRYARSQGANGTQVVGIALDNAEDVRAFLQRVPVGYPILLDTPGPGDAGVRLGNPKGVLPYSVLVGADGTVLKQRIGPFEDGELDGWAD